MKKSILFLSLVLALILSACTPKQDEIPEELISTLPAGITMTVDEETITPEGASFLLLQTTEMDIKYGDNYKLQKYDGSTWVDVPTIIENYAFHSIAYSLPENEPKVLELDWAWLYGSLPAGEYRLVKEFMDFRGTGDFDNYTIAAAFPIT